MTEKIQIKISDILRMLKEGYTRKALATHYGVTQSAMKEIFQHPELKGKRTMPKVEATYTLVDDVNGDVVADTVGTTITPVAFEASDEDHANGTEEEETQVLAEAGEDTIDPWKTS